MATDPKTLLAQAACYACYLEMDNLMVLALLAQWVSNTTVPIDPVVNAWVARARANGGNPSTKSITAVNRLWLAIKAAGIDTKMIHVNPIAPDDYQTATTPLIVGPGGFNQWHDFNGNLQGQQVNLQQGLNGDSGYTLASMFDTGVLPSLTSLSPLNGGITVYVSVQEPDGTNHTHGGCDDYASGPTNMFKLTYDFDYTAFDGSSSPNGGEVYASNGSFPGGFAPFAGFICCNLEPSGPSWNCCVYGNVNGVVAFPVLTNGTPPTSEGGLVPVGTPPHSNTFCFLDNKGNFFEPSAETISFAAFHQGLTFSQAQSLFNAVQAYRVSLGAGFV